MDNTETHNIWHMKKTKANKTIQHNRTQKAKKMSNTDFIKNIQSPRMFS